MKLSSQLSGLVWLATTAYTSAQSTTGFSFVLRTNSLDGGPVTDGYLSSFHVGAGESTIVTTQNASEASVWTLQKGVLVENASYPFVVSFLDQAPYDSDAPAGYKYIAMNIGSPDQGSEGWTFDETHTTVYYQADDFTLSVCNVNGTSPYESAGAQSQLLWRSLSSAADPRSPPRCADVGLDALRIAA